MAPKNKKSLSSTDNREHYMKIVLADTCIQCKQQCSRGLAYIDKMAKPGMIGYGVPCILSKGSQIQGKKG
ncbi:MAG TPA: hypothetical protein VJ824_06235 [Bacillota bacterium]|nr:hypothetical protein [Bacillota bacterium]